MNKQLKKEGKEPFKPIFGCEMYVARRGMQRRDDKIDLGGWHLIVLAKNLNGYRNLIKLVSRSWVDGFYNRPRTDHADLEKYHEDLIVCSACIGGEIPKLILAGDIEGARRAVEWHKNLWGDDFYLELQRHEVTDPNQRAAAQNEPSAINQLAYAYAKGKFFAPNKVKALSLISKNIEIDPKNPNWYDSKGEIYAIFGDYKNAKVMYEKVLKIDPKFYENNEPAVLDDIIKGRK